MALLLGLTGFGASKRFAVLAQAVVAASGAVKRPASQTLRAGGYKPGKVEVSVAGFVLASRREAAACARKREPFLEQLAAVTQQRPAWQVAGSASLGRARPSA